MGRIGGQYYPDIEVDEAVRIAKIIYDFPGHLMNVQTLAEKLDIKPRGGWTGMILASIKRYGLVEGRGTLRATDLAEKIVNSKSTSELQLAKQDLFNNIGLWSIIRSDYGEKALSSDFWAYLAEKLTVDRAEAKKKSEKIAKLYTNAIAFCLPPSPAMEEGRRDIMMREQIIESPTIETIEKPPTGTVRYGSSEDFGIWVKKDARSISFLETQIEAIKSWLKYEKSKLETKEEQD